MDEQEQVTNPELDAIREELRKIHEFMANFERQPEEPESEQPEEPESEQPEESEFAEEQDIFNTDPQTEIDEFLSSDESITARILKKYEEEHTNA